MKQNNVHKSDTNGDAKEKRNAHGVHAEGMEIKHHANPPLHTPPTVANMTQSDVLLLKAHANELDVLLRRGILGIIIGIKYVTVLQHISTYLQTLKLSKLPLN